MEATELEKALEQEDKFASFWAQVIRWFKKYEKPIYAIVTVAVVAYLAFWGYGQWQLSKEKAAWNEYEAVLLTLNQRNPADKAAAEKARDEAAAALTKLAGQFPAAAAGEQAGLELGALAATKGDYKTALGHYQAFYATLDKGDPMKLMMSQAIGQCYEGLKDWTNAAQWYGKLAAEDQTAALGLWNLARVAELSGDKAKAKDTYAKLLKDHAASAYSSRVKDRLAVLSD